MTIDVTESAAWITPAEGDWSLGFASLDREYREEVELSVNGSVPAELAGTLYRMGPARFDLGGQRATFWPDGDGMVHAFRFDDGTVHYRNRFVETRRKREEDAAGRRIYCLSTPFPGGPVALVKALLTSAFSPANVNITYHAGAMLATCDHTRPYRLDPVTLDTIGLDDLGVLGFGRSMISHCKIDHIRNEWWNIGLTIGVRPKLSVYRRDPSGRTHLVSRKTIPMPEFPFGTHDFALSPSKVVVVLNPLTLPRVPLRAPFRNESIMQAARWKPELGNLIMVVDRETGDCRTYRTGAFHQHHFVNAFDEDGDVVVDLCPYPDAAVSLRAFFDVMRGARTEMLPSCLERIRLRPDGGAERRTLADVPIEFPRVNPDYFLAEHHRVYGVNGYLNGPIAIDTGDGAVTRLHHRPNEYASELIPVPKQNGRGEHDVWLLCLVLAASERRTELRIFDGSNLTADPVARITAPHIIPFGYHGNWLPAGGHITLP